MEHQAIESLVVLAGQLRSWVERGNDPQAQTKEWGLEGVALLRAAVGLLLIVKECPAILLRLWGCIEKMFPHIDWEE